MLPARARATGPTVFSRLGCIGGRRLGRGRDLRGRRPLRDGARHSHGRVSAARLRRHVRRHGACRPTGDDPSAPSVTADEVQPLPAEEQPDSVTPLASDPRPEDGRPDIPRVQLFDRTTDEWVEFPPLVLSRSYRIPTPSATSILRARSWFGSSCARGHHRRIHLRSAARGHDQMTDAIEVRRPRQAIRQHARGGRRRPEHRAGEIFGLVGPNGAGKTTTLRMLSTLIEPSAGTAPICGLDIRRDPRSVRRVIGYMPDSFGVYDDMRVSEYLDFFARFYVIPAARRRQIVADLLALVDLTSSVTSTFTRSVEGCSSGSASLTPSFTIRACCCSMSRPRGWIRALGPSSATRARTQSWARRL